MLLRVEELTVGYRWKRVVHGAHLEIGEKELVYIWGPPESGKTTLLKGISGRAKVFSGERKFAGGSLAKIGPEKMARLGLILIPQKGGYFEGLKVSEHFKLAVGSEHPPDDVKWLMKDIDLQLEPERKVKKLELLEKRLLALFIALSLKPKLIMYDEPFDGLDDPEKIVKAVLFARSKFNTSFLLASRLDPGRIGIKPDKVYIMKAGLLTASRSSSSF